MTHHAQDKLVLLSAHDALMRTYLHLANAWTIFASTHPRANLRLYDEAIATAIGWASK